MKRIKAVEQETSTIDSFILYINLIFSHYKKNVNYDPIMHVGEDLLKRCSYTTMNFKTQSNSSNVFLKSLHTFEEEEIPSLEKVAGVMDSPPFMLLQCYCWGPDLCSINCSGSPWLSLEVFSSQKSLPWLGITSFHHYAKASLYQKHDKFNSRVHNCDSSDENAKTILTLQQKCFN